MQLSALHPMTSKGNEVALCCLVPFPPEIVALLTPWGSPLTVYSSTVQKRVGSLAEADRNTLTSGKIAAVCPTRSRGEGLEKWMRNSNIKPVRLWRQASPRHRRSISRLSFTDLVGTSSARSTGTGPSSVPRIKK